MKKLIILISLFFSLALSAQIGADKPSEFKKGVTLPFLQYEQMTTAERDALVVPAGTTRMIYNEDTNVLNFHNGTIWTAMSSVASIVFEKELTDAENNINVGFNLVSTSLIYYNGTLVPNNSWSGAGTQILNLNMSTKIYDHIKVKN